jgi:hypothetical protein
MQKNLKKPCLLDSCNLVKKAIQEDFVEARRVASHTFAYQTGGFAQSISEFSVNTSAFTIVLFASNYAKQTAPYKFKKKNGGMELILQIKLVKFKTKKGQLKVSVFVKHDKGFNLL